MPRGRSAHHFEAMHPLWEKHGLEDFTRAYNKIGTRQDGCQYRSEARCSHLSWRSHKVVPEGLSHGTWRRGAGGLREHYVQQVAKVRDLLKTAAEWQMVVYRDKGELCLMASDLKLVAQGKLESDQSVH